MSCVCPEAVDYLLLENGAKAHLSILRINVFHICAEVDDCHIVFCTFLM